MKYREEPYHVHWKSPSNIALVKYWGKKGMQLPANPSISFTLDSSLSDTRIKATYKKEQKSISLNFYFEGEKNESFETKVSSTLENCRIFFTWLDNFHLDIYSSNTFPHSSGIASSASAFSALALCLCSLHEEITGNPLPDFFRTASNWSRLGSGSACRSVYGGYNLWGKSPAMDGSSDEFAINIDKVVHTVFKAFNDTILIIDKGKKAVSSSSGHALLNEHPFAALRYQIAFENTEKLLGILKSGNIDEFIHLVEYEALMLHTLMMTSDPSFILIKPNTLAVIERIRDYRKQTGRAVMFTLDAGANVHILNPVPENSHIQDFVKNELLGFCQNESYFCNAIGKGPEKIKV